MPWDTKNIDVVINNNEYINVFKGEMAQMTAFSKKLINQCININKNYKRERLERIKAETKDFMKIKF